MSRKLITILSPAYNEAENVDELYRRLCAATEPLREKYDFQFLIIDNNSSYKESKEDLPSKMRHIQNSNIDHYIQYLKQMVKDKATQHKLDLPPLCQCNLESNIWENDWNQCANNCIFYKNPKGILFLFFKSSFVKIILNKLLFKIFQEYTKVLLNLITKNLSEKA
jgi:hypothetical protein